MGKISRTFTVESETIKILDEHMKKRDLSSYSSALERIILEWYVLQENKIDVQDIVQKVLEKLDINNKNVLNSKKEEENSYHNCINNMFEEMPD